ncbi:MAG: glycosyltransferase [Gemmatimonadetes bacterium]|nr:glycosyltransferase [Gemmatimonadota bacterium]
MKLVIQNGSRVWGGNEKWLATLAAGLAARGHEVVVSCRGSGPVPDELRRRGIRTAPVRPGGYADVGRGVRFRRWLRRERPDALLLTSWRTTFWGAWAGRRAGVPRVVVRLGIVRELEHGRHALPFRRWVDALVVNAREIRDAWLRSAPWFPAEAVHVVFNGIVPADAPPEEATRALRARLGAGPETLLVGGVGNLTYRKGFDLLLDAFAAAAVPDARVVIVGAGPEEGALRERAARLGVADRVHFAGQRSDVPEVLAACDLFVLSSRNEGMANVMLEAMAVGTPVVAADVSGVRDAVGLAEGGAEAGWIVPPDDAAALRITLREVLTDLRAGAGEAARRAEEARRRIRERFGVERMVDEVERVLFPGIETATRPARPAARVRR